jgi:hypothetical protein
MFQRNISRPSLGSQSKLRKKPTRSRQCALPVVSSLAYSLTLKMEVSLEHQALLAYKALPYSLNTEDCGPSELHMLYNLLGSY